MKTETKKYCFSFDAETDGLWGQAFAIAAVVVDTGTGAVIDQFEARLPDSDVKTAWVRQNILPVLSAPVTHDNYAAMLKTFAEFYHKHRNQCVFVTHMGYIVESKIIRDMHDLSLIGDFEAPYPLLDVSGNLEQAGYDPTSVEAYARANYIESEFKSVAHDPLYDADITAKVYCHLLLHN